MSVVGMPCYEDGFRLAGPPSECSLRSKARIDALFEDCRSVCSSMLGGWYAGVSTMASASREDAAAADEQRRVNSAVQARIEAMFASVEAESGTPGECAAAILPVKYMGAAPVGGRVASVRGLQEPLRQLVERIEGSVRAELEVSRRGLTFRTSEVCEKINPFRRIAVWSALKLRCKRALTGELHHAFLPLVGDQEQSQRGEEKHADLYRTMHGLESEVDHYPPIFAVVMRRPGAARLLECHAFACDTEEDAVAAAATLYRALLADLDANRRRPRHANGLGCVSLASVASSVRDASSIGRNYSVAPATPAPHPVRPPRAKKHSVSSSVTEDESARSAELQKAPRRKKKNSDVKAEDVLEARGRRASAIAKTDATESASEKGRDIVARSEEWQNARNDRNVRSPSNEIGRPASRLEDAYGARQSVNEMHERRSNHYEKTSVASKRDREDNPAKIYALVARDETTHAKVLSTDDPCEARNARASCDARARNAEDDACPRWDHCAATASVHRIYERIERASCASRENSMYERSVREKVREERYKDAHGTRKVDREELQGQRSGRWPSRNESSSLENAKLVAGSRRESPSRRSVEIRDNASVGERERRSGEPESVRSCKRLSRVVTMDKPLRKPGDAADARSKVSECGQPRVRKRSRAGSEPPVSRSEDAERGVRETGLKRSQSDVDVDRGDLLTRVELPRRGSFLNSGSAGRPVNINGGTPLGFTELFDEFRNQEGLTSVDDILAAIIDPEGMSFNDLKPLYKEFLLKLAATLTQDELYQRSASIMRRRRRPQRRRSTRRPCLLGRAIRRSVSRLKGGPTEFTSVIFPARRLNDSFGSSSSCDARNTHRGRVLASRVGRRKSSWKANKGHTTSEDSDTCRRLSRGQAVGANRSSSGYVSCSECSYDSESCTCVSADKCYCSLSRRAPVQPLPVNTLVCACDTDSCSESNKCYCARKPVQSTILEQLRQRGIVPSESTLSRAATPDRIGSSKAGRMHNSSCSVELIKNRPSCGSSDNLALDYDLFSPGRKSQQSSGSEKVLVVSARDTQGRLVYVGGADRDKKCLAHGSARSGAHHEALSIKKSAEIAAVFGADSGRVARRTSNASSVRSSVSLEAGLGYLP